MMKKRFILLGVFLGAVLLQPVFAEEEPVNTKFDLMNRGDRKTILQATGINIGFPVPMKIGIRKIAVPGSDMSPIVERQVDQVTLKKEIAEMEAKRAHFSEQKKENSSPAERLHGIVMKRGPLSGMEKKDMVPPVSKQGSYSSFSRDRQGK